MSREKDPNIHTHPIVANRILCADGAWRTVDGRAIYAASVGARALYEQALEAELPAQLGVEFSLDERKTIRKITGIPLPLIQHFSKRRAATEHAPRHPCRRENSTEGVGETRPPLLTLHPHTQVRGRVHH